MLKNDLNIYHLYRSCKRNKNCLTVNLSSYMMPFRGRPSPSTKELSLPKLKEDDKKYGLYHLFNSTLDHFTGTIFTLLHHSLVICPSIHGLMSSYPTQNAFKRLSSRNNFQLDQLGGSFLCLIQSCL